MSERTPGWCTTHDDFAWLYGDGSIGCFGATIVEESSSGCVLTQFLVAASIHEGMHEDFPSIRAKAEWIADQWNDPDSITHKRIARLASEEE